MAQSANFRTQTPTAFCLRLKRMMSTKTSQQKGLGQNERRMQWNLHSRVCLSEIENVLDTER